MRSKKARRSTPRGFNPFQKGAWHALADTYFPDNFDSLEDSAKPLITVVLPGGMRVQGYLYALNRDGGISVSEKRDSPNPIWEIDFRHVIAVCDYGRRS